MAEHDTPHMRAPDGDVRCLEGHAEREAEIEEIPIIGLADPRHLEPAAVAAIGLPIIEMRIVKREDGVREEPGERSEEHTSELQSLMRISYAVFCLKTKTKTNNQTDKKIKQTQNQTRPTSK